LSGLIATLLVCAWVCQSAQAQRFDGQWKYRSMGMAEGGLVPDDSPPMGFRMTETETRLQQMEDPGFSYGDGAAFRGAYYPARRSVKRSATAHGAKQHDEAAEWLNGAGGSSYGNMAVSDAEHRRLKALRARAAQQKADAAARERAQIFSNSTVDSGGLIRGIGELK